MPIGEDYSPQDLRDQILELVLSIYHEAAAANGWLEPPQEVEDRMSEIFRLVTLGLKITE